MCERLFYSFQLTNCKIVTFDFLECSYFFKLSLWCRSLSQIKLSFHLQKKSKTCLYVIERCKYLIDYVSYCAIETMNMFMDRCSENIFQEFIWEHLRPVTMLKKRLYLHSKGKEFYWKETYEFCIVLFEATSRKA